MVSATEHLRELRRQLEATFDARARQVVEPLLALLTQITTGLADAPAPAEELLDQLEELLEALMYERGWAEPAGGRR